MVNFIYFFNMTLASTNSKTVLVGVSESGHRVGVDHPNHNKRITPILVDALRDLNEEGIGYGCLSLMFGISRGYIAQICRYEKRVSYPVRWKSIKTNR